MQQLAKHKSPFTAGLTALRYRVARFVRALKFWSGETREVVVFISSPGDCAAERYIACRIVKKLSSAPEVKQQNLSFKPLLWEDLPPGFAEGADFQGRLNELMAKYGYDQYGIYIGFMKGRLGTRTPRHDSGTIEELEISLSGQRRFGTPSEVLFYFLQPDADRSEDVASFRKKLEGRGFLSARTPVEAFEDRLTANLEQIFFNWSGWRARARRLWRRARLIGLTGIVLLLAGGLATDQINKLTISQALKKSGAAAAADLWASRSTLMPLSAAGARDDINAAAVREIDGTGELSDRLAKLTRWRGRATYEPDAFAPVTARLAKQTLQTLDQSLLSDPDPSAPALWREAEAAGAWHGRASEAERALRELAAARLMQSLVPTGVAAQSWAGSLLREHELAQLKTVSQKIIRGLPDLNGIKERMLRTAIPVMAGDAQAAARLATEGIQRDTAGQPEVAAFMAMAPAGTAVQWVETLPKLSYPSHTLARTIEAAIARPDAAPVLALLRLSEAGRLIDDATALFSDRTCPVPQCERGAGILLTSWAARGPDRLPPPDALEFLLPALKAADLEISQRLQIERMLIGVAEQQDITPVIINALSGLGTPGADAFLLARAGAHGTGKVFYGFAQKASLLDHIARRPDTENGLQLARNILLQAERTVAEDTAAGANTVTEDNLRDIETGYFSVLAGSMDEAGDEDLEAVVRITDRIGRRADPFGYARYIRGLARRQSAPEALGRVLKNAPEQWLNQLFKLPGPPVIDLPWDPIWKRRRILLRALAEAPGPPPGIIASVLPYLPDDRPIKDEFFDLISKIDPAAARRYLTYQLETGKLEAAVKLAKLGDLDNVASLLEEKTWNKGAEAREVFLKAIGQSATSVRRQLIEQTLARRPELAPDLLDAARALREPVTGLDATAAELATATERPGLMQSAVAYLARHAPAALWASFETQPARAKLTAWLRDADPSSWVGFAQELPVPVKGSGQTALAEFARARPMLLALDEGPGGKKYAEHAAFALNAQKLVYNHLLGYLALHTEPRAAREVLEGMSIESAQSETAVVGKLNDPGTVFRAYLTWLAGGLPEDVSAGCSKNRFFGIGNLGDTNPAVKRAASSYLLVHGRPSQDAECPVLQVSVAN